MKKIALILLVLVIACKKENPKPAPDPVPSPPVCEKSPTVFAGTYEVYLGHTQGQIKITFLQDNCPTKAKHNFYLIKDFAQAIQPYMETGKTAVVKDYTMLVDEAAGSGRDTSSTNAFVVTRNTTTGTLTFTDNDINGEVRFKKLY